MPLSARVPIPDERFEWLCQLYQPASKVSSYLEVWDIAGLVRGASEGEGTDFILFVILLSY